MNVVPVIRKIPIVPDAVISESRLPDFALTAEDVAESMRVSALDELNGMFNRHIASRREEHMDVFRHDNEGMQLKASFTSVSVHGFQE